MRATGDSAYRGCELGHYWCSHRLQVQTLLRRVSGESKRTSGGESHSRGSYGEDGEYKRGLVAGTGAYLLQRRGLIAPDQVREFFSGIEKSADAIYGRVRRLSRKAEEDLCRRCYVLALFEEIARVGLLPGTPLTRLPKHPSVDDLLGVVDAERVEELVQMAWRFYATQKPLLTGRALVGADIGGTDPDLIVDRCLIEIKTAIDPGKITKPSWPWQLLGYALLDYGDFYELESVALYLARQGLLVRWPLDEYVRLLAGHEVSVAEARRDLRRAVA